MAVQSLEKLLVDELRDLLSAEKQITKALPKMAKAASAERGTLSIRSQNSKTNQKFSSRHRP